MPDAAHSPNQQEAPEARAARWADCCLAIELLAVDRAGLGGMSLRAQAGPVRDVALAVLAAHFGTLRRMPAGIGDEALLGGLDLPATLQAGRPIQSGGLLRAAQGGIVLAIMAERMAQGVAARVTMAIDDGADLAVVALDEGIEPEERCGAALLDRLAFHVDLTALSHRDVEAGVPDAAAIAEARGRLPLVQTDPELLEALCNTALVLGIGSPRAVLLALRVARAAAALDGREAVTLEDATLATRLVLAARATRLPPPAETEEQPQPGEDDQQDQESEPELAQARPGHPARPARWRSAGSGGRPGPRPERER